MFRRSAALVACLFLFALVPAARATVMVEIPLEDMIADAPAIVHGVVVRSGTQMIMQRGSLQPHTVTELRVTRWLKGGGGSTVTIRELGGTWQGGGTWIDGTPRYGPREEVVVFLRPDPLSSSFYRTYGMVQGKFIVLRGAPGVPTSVRRDLEAISFAHWANGRMTVAAAPAHPPAMAMDSFLAFVDGVLGSITSLEGR